jgi:hypothetical protein
MEPDDKFVVEIRRSAVDFAVRVLHLQHDHSAANAMKIAAEFADFMLCKKAVAEDPKN